MGKSKLPFKLDKGSIDEILQFAIINLLSNKYKSPETAFDEAFHNYLYLNTYALDKSVDNVVSIDRNGDFEIRPPWRAQFHEFMLENLSDLETVKNLDFTIPDNRPDQESLRNSEFLRRVTEIADEIATATGQ